MNSLWKQGTAVVLVAAAVFVAACGGSDATTSSDATTGSDATTTGAPVAEQPLADAVAAINVAIASQDCEQYVALMMSSIRVSAVEGQLAEPNQPVQPEECAKGSPNLDQLTNIKGTVFDQSEEYGPAAISDGSGGKKAFGRNSWTVVWGVDRDGQWRAITIVAATPQVGKDLPTSIDAKATADEFVASVQDADCSGAKGLYSRYAFLAGSPQKACDGISNGVIFAPAVRAADSVTTEVLGDGPGYALAGIDTGDAYFVALFYRPSAPDGGLADRVELLNLAPL